MKKAWAKKNKSGFISILCTLLLLPVAASILLLIDQKQVVTQAAAQAEQELSRSAQRQTDMLSVMLDGKYEILRVVANDIDVEANGFRGEEDKLRQFANAANFSLLLLVNERGYAYYPDGMERTVQDRFYFHAAQAGQEAIQKLDVGRSDGKPRFVLAVPMQYGDKKGVVFGTLEIDEFERMVTSSAYSESGLTYITDAKGLICLGEEKLGITGSFPSIFQKFNQVTYQGEYSADKLKEDLKTGKSGTFAYQINGDHEVRYVSFQALTLAPQSEYPWYVFNEIPESAIDAVARAARENSVRNTMAVMLAGIVAILVLLLQERNHRRLILEDAERLRASEETSRIALEMTDKIISRYDICNRTWRSQSAYVSELKAEVVMENMPDSMIAAGVIGPESEAEYRTFYDSIHKGVPRGRCVIRIVRANGSSYWEQNDYVTIFDANHQPTSAVISAEDVTLRRQMELAYEKWRQTVERLPKDRAALYEHNLTRDTCNIMEGGLLPAFPAGGYQGVNERTSFISRRFVAPEDAERFRQFVNRERLLADFAAGKSEQSLLFRRGKRQQRERFWTRLSIQMVCHSNEVTAYMLFEDVDELKREELTLLARSERDALTGAYDRAAFQKRVEALFHEGGLLEQHAILMIDVDNFKVVNDTKGHDVGDQVLIDIAETLHSAMRAGDLVGRLGGDEFMVCFRDVPGKELVQKRAQELCEKLHMQICSDLSISSSLGVVLYPEDGVTFEALYKKVDEAMYQAKRSGKDGVAFYQDIR
ncbi:MAG: sensor domain-containing diguanylate cyclase [Eubacteriales bacterium]|nr:sensor domain-containing diguanylate cyclase [Eubacteriales bacterium]